MQFLVVGSPVGHSLSPAMMRAAFRAIGIEATYETREIPAAAWPAAMADLFREGLTGVNVTVPHKELTLEGARWVNPNARAIGAANWMARMPGGWRVDNTDGPGFARWLVELRAGKRIQKEALVLGAGGSARAVAWALREAGCKKVRVANRTLARAETLGRRWKQSPLVAEKLGGKAPEGGVVVNCTSLGLRADDPPPITAELLEGAGLVLDLVYPETPLVRMAQELGIPAHDGLGMLAHQGAFSLELWVGKTPPQEVLVDACREELARRA